MSTQSDYEKAQRQMWRTAALVKLGGKCVRCGFDDPRALQFDHVNGDGYKFRQERIGAGGRRPTEHGGVYYKKIAEGRGLDTELQILCANCNWIKRAENHET